MSTTTTRSAYRRTRATQHSEIQTFRPDIEGLRAVAVGLVLLAHAGIGPIEGGFLGVDVFFVISGFLITGLLVREADGTGRISLLRFWARRAKRLLPASAVVLVASALITWVFLPTLRWEEAGGDIVAAAAYIVNWHLASRSVDYLAEDSAPSIVQHYWSLSVEEQFYVLWPLLLLLCVWLARRLDLRLQPVLLVGLTALVIPSLAWSVYQTSQSPAEAYFVTPTRLWELGIGGLVALTAPYWVSISAANGRRLSWGGLGIVVASAFVVNTDMAWPGALALLPVVATAAVIAGGFRARSTGAVRILRHPVLQRIGGLSYAIYLWHWPLLIVAEHHWGPLTWWQGLLAVASSIIPAWLTYTLVENPVRRSASLAKLPQLALIGGLVLTLISVGAGLTVKSLAAAEIQSVRPGDAQGAAALQVAPAPATQAAPTPGSTPTPTADPAAAGPDVSRLDLVPESITPDPLRAVYDVPAIQSQGCQATLLATAVKRCDLGSPNGTLTVALVGDSKAAQWVDALDPVAKQRNWRLQTYLKASCPWTDADVPSDTPNAEQACRTWGSALLTTLTGPTKPDVIIVSGVKNEAAPTPGQNGAAAMVTGYVSFWNRLAANGVPVIVLKDTPSPGGNMYGCVADNRRQVDRCMYNRNDGSGTPALTAAAAQVPGTKVVSMNDWICPLPSCPAVIGNVMVYRQGSHVTRTYIETLTNTFGARLAPAVAAATGTPTS